MARHAKIENHQNGTVTIRGLTPGDLRLISRAVREGAWAGGDRGGPVSDALVRLSEVLATPARYEGAIGSVVFVCATDDPTELYADTLNL